MSSNLFNSEVAARIGSVYPNNSIRLFQNLSDKTLCVIGTSQKGKAFVPTNITDVESINVLIGGNARQLSVVNNLDNVLGTARNNRYRNLQDNLNCIVESQSYDALKVWLDNGGDQATFTRVLGIGSSTKSSEGNYIGSGFNAEKNISKGSTDDLTKSDNPKAIAPITVSGNVSFILNKFTQHTNFNYLEDLDLNENEDNYFLTSTIISPQGVLPSLGNVSIENNPIENIAAQYTNQVKEKNYGIVYVHLLGLDQNIDAKKNIILDSKRIIKPLNQESRFQENIFNDFFLEKGHIVYSQYTSNNLLKKDESHRIISTRNFSSLNNITLPDFNSFEDKYQTAKTPWITSQPINRSSILDNRQTIQNKVAELFRFYALDDGEIGNRFRIKINPLTRGDIEENIYSTFEVYIFEYNAITGQFIEVDHKETVNLNPDDSNYIARLFGDENTYYDIELKKVVTSVKHEQRNRYLRVEVHSDVEDKKINCDLIPSGFRAYPHIRLNSECFPDYDFDFDKIFQMPVHYSPHYLKDTVLPETSTIKNNWGCIFSKCNFSDGRLESTNYINQNISPFYYYTKYFINNLKTGTKNIWVEDDTYLNSFFHLEKIYTSTNFDSTDKLLYSRKSAPEDERTYLNLDDLSHWDNDKTLVGDLKDKLSFDLFTYGGFDGTDIRDLDKKILNNNAITREVNGEDTTINFEKNPTYNSYLTSISLIKENILNADYIVMPGISNIDLTQKCINICENDKDKIFISDVLTYNNILKESLIKVTDIYNRSLGQAEGDMEVSNSAFLEYNNAYSNTITNKTLSSSFNSKYLVHTYGTVLGRNAEGGLKVLDPSIYVIKRIAQNLNNITTLVDSEKLNSYDLRLVQVNLCRESSTWESDIKSLRENYINALFFPVGQGVNLNSQTTSFNIRNSTFSLFSIVDKLLKVKKEIKIALMTQRIFGSSEPLLFNQNSSIQNINSKLEIQLRNILDNLVNNNTITNYNVRIPSIVDNQSIVDAQNYIIRGTIALQFNENNNLDIINIELADILNEISLLSGSSAEEIIEARF
jgi:hypothetical protein